MTRFIIPALVAFLVSGPAWGAKTDGSINGFLQYYDNSDAEEKRGILRTIDFTVRGMEIINSDLKSKGRPQTFCLTEADKMRLNISTEYYFSIFRKYFEKHNDLREAHHRRFDHILHSALQEAFPCPVSGPTWADKQDGVFLHCRGVEDLNDHKGEPDRYPIYENYRMALDGSWIAQGGVKVKAHQKETWSRYNLKIGWVTRLITFYPKDLKLLVRMRLDVGSGGKPIDGRYYTLFCAPFKNPVKF